MNQQTNSQVALQYVLTTYPCLKSWMDFVTNVTSNALSYDAVSCAQIALIGESAMKTFDYICVYEKNAGIISVSMMLFDLHDVAWRIWTAFTAQSRKTVGTRSIMLTSIVLQGLSTFQNWDSALDPNPSYFNPPALLNSILQGVTL